METKNITVLVEEENITGYVTLAAKKSLYAGIEELVGMIHKKFPTVDEFRITYDDDMRYMKFIMIDNREDGYSGLVLSYDMGKNDWRNDFLTQFVIGLDDKVSVNNFVTKSGLSDNENYETRKDLDGTYVLNYYKHHEVVSSAVLNAENEFGRMKDRFLN